MEDGVRRRNSTGRWKPRVEVQTLFRHVIGLASPKCASMPSSPSCHWPFSWAVAPQRRNTTLSSKIINISHLVHKVLEVYRIPGGAPSETVVTSPMIETLMVPGMGWWLSWNVPAGRVSQRLKRAAFTRAHATKFYTLGLWSDDPSRHPREEQQRVNRTPMAMATPTARLSCKRPALKAQLRLTVGGAPAGKLPPLKFVGLSFCDSRKPDMPQPFSEDSVG